MLDLGVAVNIYGAESTGWASHPNLTKNVAVSPKGCITVDSFIREHPLVITGLIPKRGTAQFLMPDLAAYLSDASEVVTYVKALPKDQGLADNHG
jgi:hypothetical protein